MAKHTLTVSDIDGGISIRVGGDDSLESSAAGRVVKMLIDLIGQAAADASALQADDCPCPQCQIRRAAEGLAAPQSTLLH